MHTTRCADSPPTGARFSPFLKASQDGGTQSPVDVVTHDLDPRLFHPCPLDDRRRLVRRPIIDHDDPPIQARPRQHLRPLAQQFTNHGSLIVGRQRQTQAFVWRDVCSPNSLLPPERSHTMPPRPLNIKSDRPVAQRYPRQPRPARVGTGVGVGVGVGVGSTRGVRSNSNRGRSVADVASSAKNEMR